MKTIIRVVCAVALLAAGAAVAAQQEKTKLKFAFDEDGAHDEVTIVIDSEKDGFSPKDLQVGESRSITAEDGRPVLLTRTETGLELDINGRKVDVPMTEDGDGMVRKHVRIMGDGDGKEHKMMKRHAIALDGGSDHAVIVSRENLDDATRSQIEAALAAAGISDVRFIAHSEMQAGLHEEHEVKIVRKKKVEATN